MPAWPKSILSFGANLLTARTALRLRSRDRGLRGQRRALAKVLAGLARTSYWREAGVSPGMSYASFRSRVAPREYDAVQPAVERMMRGEADVLWPGKCMFFAASSGTTSGTPRIVPVTAPMLQHFRMGLRDALLYYTARVGNAGVFAGKHLFLSGSTAMNPAGGDAAGQAFVGAWPAIALLAIPPSLERAVCEPGPEVGALSDWGTKVDAISERTRHQDTTLLLGIPPWVEVFAETVCARQAPSGRPVGDLQQIWPNLECLIHGGMPLGPHQAELRALLGKTVRFHEMYSAVEGVFAAQDSAPDAGLRLMTDLGVFFEFIPVAEFDAAHVEVLGERAVPLAEVRTGIDYVILVTSPAGLARYVVGDVVRFTSLQPPRIEWVGRTRLQLTAFGERVMDRDVTEALVNVCQRHRWSIVNFHVAPLPNVNLTGQARGRHEWWVELKPGTVETPTGPQMAMEVDTELRRINADYGERRAAGRIDPPTVRLVMPGVFRHWLKFHHVWDGANKFARCRSDRLIADELAQITRFAHD